MLSKFVLVGLLFLSYNIIIDLYTSNMICDVQKNDIMNYYYGNHNIDVINYNNTIQNNESFILNGDIEEGLGECEVCNSRVQISNIYTKNYLIFELISNMSYKIIKNMKQMVCKHVNYFYPSGIKKKSGFCL
jgi:hypothetical protein